MWSVLRFVGIGDTPQLSMVAHGFGRSFNHEIEAVEGAMARRKDALTVSREVLRFTFVWASAEVQRPFQPDGQQRRDMRTTIRSNGRKPIHLRTRELVRAWDHSVGIAFGLLKALSAVTGSGSVIHSPLFTFVRANTAMLGRIGKHHRPTRPEMQFPKCNEGTVLVEACGAHSGSQ